MPPSTSWFDLGADALQRVRPDLPRGYGCPLCLRLFPPEAAHLLTREDVPPRARGGRPIVLTCRECNSQSGATFDAAADVHEGMIDFARGTMTKPMDVRVRVEDLTLNGIVLADGNTVSIEGLQKRNPPDTSDVWKQLLRSIDARNEGWPEIKLEFTRGYVPKDAHLSWLRAAYLAAFTLWGYSYILRQSVRQVRLQLAHPNEELIRSWSITEPGNPPDLKQMMIVREPEWLHSLLVRMGRHSVFLPWGDHDVYGHIAQDVDRHTRGDFTLHGETFDWPKQPVFAFDLN